MAMATLLGEITVNFVFVILVKRSRFERNSFLAEQTFSDRRRELES